VVGEPRAGETAAAGFVAMNSRTYWSMSGSGKRAGPEPYFMYLHKTAGRCVNDGMRLVTLEGTAEEQQGRKPLGRDGDSLGSEARRGKPR